MTFPEMIAEWYRTHGYTTFSPFLTTTSLSQRQSRWIKQTEKVLGRGGEGACSTNTSGTFR